MPKQTHRREVVRDNKGNRHFVSPMRDWKDVLWTRQNGRCWVCGELMVRKAMRNADGSQDGMHATIDHLRPQNQGGSDEVSNLALAHYSCNCLRGRNNLIPLGTRLNAAEGLLIKKDAEIAVLIAAKAESERLLEVAGRVHAITLKRCDQAHANYTTLRDMPKPQCACWWCGIKKVARANWTRLIAADRDTSGL